MRDLSRELACYAAVATLVCATVLPDPLRLALGMSGNDVWNHIWGYWWVADCIARGELPIHTDLLGWPTGGSLWFIDTFDAVITLPIQWLAGPVAAWPLELSRATRWVMRQDGMGVALEAHRLDKVRGWGRWICRVCGHGGMTISISLDLTQTPTKTKTPTPTNTKTPTNTQTPTNTSTQTPTLPGRPKTRQDSPE